MSTKQNLGGLVQFVKGRRLVLAILVITLVSMTCSNSDYEPVFLGTVVDGITQNPLDSVLVWISDYELPDANTGEYSRHSGGSPGPSDTNGHWRTEAFIIVPLGGCGSRIDGPAGVEQFYFRFERDGYLTLDTTFSGNLLEQNRIKCDIFQVPDIDMVADTTS